MDAKLRKEMKQFFKEEFAETIKEKLKTGHSIDDLSVNPLILIALSSGVFGSPTSANMAKALLYPRVFGTSINTSFGEKMQRLCIRYLGAKASGVAGMDIEFFDLIDKKPVLMQLKAGPNTINSKDVKPILQEMAQAYRLLRQNGIGKSMPIFAIGVTYGTTEELNGNYKKILSSSVMGQLFTPIFVGQDFWYRLTGDKNFYSEMVRLFFELFDQEDYSELLQTDLNNLALGIEKKYFTKGGFDIRKI